MSKNAKKGLRMCGECGVVGDGKILLSEIWHGRFGPKESSKERRRLCPTPPASHMIEIVFFCLGVKAALHPGGQNRRAHRPQGRPTVVHPELSKSLSRILRNRS
jgi:hypothetical protein